MRGYGIALTVIAMLFNASSARALDDGFGSAKKIEGNNIVVYCSPETDIADLIQGINIRPSDKILAGGSLGLSSSYENELGRMLDTLFTQVSDILDMRVYGLKVNIKLCEDHSHLKDIYRRMFDSDLQDRKSFFVYTLNTIYTSREHFKREIVGHEIAHAIISRYFAIPAPVKVQEVLSMYVEHSLRRAKE